MTVINFDIHFICSKDDDWQDGKSLSECNLHMLTNEISCDVTFLVGEREEVVMAHTYVLMSRAPKLSRLFADQSKFLSKLVMLPDVQPEPFRLMLRYLYSGDIDLSTQQASSMISIVHKYGPQSLTKRCFEQILTEMTSESACDVLEKCHEHGEMVCFNSCLEFIHANGKDVLTSRGIRQLCRECLENVISSDDLNAEEIDVFHALISWADYHCRNGVLTEPDSNRRQTLGNLIFHVRFTVMPVTEFTEKVSTRNLLTSDEKIKIFRYHHGSKNNLPSHFIVTRRKTQREKVEQPLVDNYKERITTITTPPAKSNKIDKFSKRQMAVDQKGARLLKVNRFQAMDGDWKNNGPDAISFKCSHPISLHGIQVFSSFKGSKGFILEIAIFNESGSLVCRETSTVVCRDGYPLFEFLFTDPVRVPDKRLFTIQTYSKGPPVHCGKKGLAFVNVENVRFDFVASCKSLNGTDVTIGQIPVLLFSIT